MKQQQFSQVGEIVETIGECLICQRDLIQVWERRMPYSNHWAMLSEKKSAPERHCWRNLLSSLDAAFYCFVSDACAHTKAAELILKIPQ